MLLNGRLSSSTSGSLANDIPADVEVFAASVTVRRRSSIVARASSTLVLQAIQLHRPLPLLRPKTPPLHHTLRSAEASSCYE